MSLRMVLPLVVMIGLITIQPVAGQLESAPMPRSMECKMACVGQISRVCGVRLTVHIDGPGGWWLNEARLPQPKHGASQQCQPEGCGEWPEQFSHTAVPRHGVHRSAPSNGSSGKLSGTWYRELEGVVIAATFSGDELKLCMSQCENENTICITLTADYAMTREGLVHGVVTGVDVEMKRASHAPAGGLCVMPPAAMTAELQKLVDCPFSFRTKCTSAGVMVSNLKLAADGMEKEALGTVCGMFKPVHDGKLPAPRPSRASADSSCAPLVLPAGGRTLPSGRYLEHHPQYFPPDQWTAPPSAIVPSTYCPPQPTNVPAGEFGMMADVFGQMLGAKAAPILAPMQSPPANASCPPVRPMAVPAPPRIERPR